jgi:cytochrome c-type protein NapC
LRVRWWASLRQAYPSRRPITLAVLVLLFCLVVGGGMVVAANATIHATSTEQFCSNACHELRDNAAAEFKDTIHDKNRTGVRAACADCHIPQEFVPMMIRKVEASREMWGHLTGYIDTKEKYEKNRHAMATREWTRMKKNDSQECRNCHTPAGMDPEKQSENARARHAKAKAEGNTCIDCHFGIAHTEPDGPGPREIKVAK